MKTSHGLILVGAMFGLCFVAPAIALGGEAPIPRPKPVCLFGHMPVCAWLPEPAGGVIGPSDLPEDIGLPPRPGANNPLPELVPPPIVIEPVLPVTL